MNRFSIFFISAALLLAAPSAFAMCGGGAADTPATKAQAPAGMQCGGSMGGMSDMKMDAQAADAAKPADPHAGMDMGDGKSGGKMMGCCKCCDMGGSMGGGDSKAGGMCGKQAAVAEDGKNDPLLKDPMWNKSKQLPQSHGPAAP
jgi:hypothetical protein